MNRFSVSLSLIVPTVPALVCAQDLTAGLNEAVRVGPKGFS